MSSRNRTNSDHDDLDEHNMRNNQFLAQSGVVIRGSRRIRVGTTEPAGFYVVAPAVEPAGFDVVAPAAEPAGIDLVAPAAAEPTGIDLVAPAAEPTGINACLPFESTLLSRSSDRIGLANRRFNPIGRWLCSSIAEYDREYSLPRIFDVRNIKSISDIRVRVRVVVTGHFGDLKAVLQIVSLKFPIPVFTHELQSTSFDMDSCAATMEEIFRILITILYDKVANKFVKKLPWDQADYRASGDIQDNFEVFGALLESRSHGHIQTYRNCRICDYLTSTKFSDNPACLHDVCYPCISSRLVTMELCPVCDFKVVRDDLDIGD